MSLHDAEVVAGRQAVDGAGSVQQACDVGATAPAGGSLHSARSRQAVMPGCASARLVSTVRCPLELCCHLWLSVAGGSQSVVLDAELVAVDRANGNKLRAFQELATRARSEVTEQQVGAETWWCPFVLEAGSLKAAVPCDKH